MKLQFNLTTFVTSKDLVWLEPLPGDVGYDSKYPELRKKGLPANILYSEVVAKFDLFSQITRRYSTMKILH